MDYENNEVMVDETVDTVDETISEETQEVAEPETVESEESQEVAEPEKSKADAAFAEMRRQLQAAEEEKRQLNEALGLYFDGETAEEKYLQAQAHYQERPLEEVQQEIQAQKELKEKETQFEQLAQENLKLKAERAMEQGLKEIQSIDSSITDLRELGQDFANYIRAGLSNTDAYYATIAKKNAQSVTPAKPVGDVSPSETERDYYTEDEIDKMTTADIKKIPKEKLNKSLRMIAKSKL